MADQTNETMVKAEADPRVNHYLTELQNKYDLNKYEAASLALEKARANKLGLQNDE